MTATPKPRSLDRRRQLSPRDYLTNPYQFGIDPTATFVVPPGGDAESLEVARVIHRCLIAWRRCEPHLSGAELGRRFGFSRQTWSTITQGRRWPGHTVLAAAVAARDPNFARRRPLPALTDTRTFPTTE